MNATATAPARARRPASPALRGRRAAAGSLVGPGAADAVPLLPSEIEAHLRSLQSRLQAAHDLIRNVIDLGGCGPDFHQLLMLADQHLDEQRDRFVAVPFTKAAAAAMHASLAATLSLLAGSLALAEQDDAEIFRPQVLHAERELESVWDCLDSVLIAPYAAAPSEQPGAPVTNEELPRARRIITRDTQLSEGGQVAIRLVERCAWDIEPVCEAMLALTAELSAEDGSLLRCYSLRVLALNSLIVSYFSDDAVSLNDASRVIGRDVDPLPEGELV